MNHQKAIVDRRIDNLQRGANDANKYIRYVYEMLDSEDYDKGLILKQLDEIRDYLIWLSNQ